MEGLEIERDDDQFRARFEEGTRARALEHGSHERWVPGFCSPETELAHVNRYRWACQFVAGRRVLDIACGVGRGSLMLADEGGARSVLGVDIDPETIRYAQLTSCCPGVSFEVGDAEAFVGPEAFDVVVSFETIEHLRNVDAYLKAIQGVMAPEGLLLVSTPICQQAVDHRPENPFHTVEWGLDAFRELVERYFKVEAVFVQLRKPPRTIPMRIFGKLVPPFDVLVPVEPERFPSPRSPGVKFKGYQIAVLRPRL